MTTKVCSPWLHRAAIFIAVCTFLLLVAGALVTSNDAGLSVPDWPTSFGSFRLPPMVGGVKFEHGHRMMAGAVGILTILVVVALGFQDGRRWVKWTGGAAVLAVLAQAALRGITVLRHLPVAISTGHATLGQVFFCLTASLAFFTRPGWRWDEPKLEDPSAPSLQHLTLALTGTVLLQLIVGAAYRHSGLSVTPHVVGACLVTLLAAWIVVRIATKFPSQPALLKPAMFLGALLMIQLTLGMGAYIVKTANPSAVQPLPPVVLLATTHVAVGALLLLTSLYLTYQTQRFLAPSAGEPAVVSAPRRATL